MVYAVYTFEIRFTLTITFNRRYFSKNNVSKLFPAQITIDH